MSQQMATPRPHVTEGQAQAVAEAARETEWRQPSFAKELYLRRFQLDLEGFLAGASAKDEIYVHAASWYAEQDVDLRLPAVDAGSHRHQVRRESENDLHHARPHDT